MKLSRNILILFAIIALGLCLRAYHITADGIWLDEGYSIRIAHLGIFRLWKAVVTDVHPPLHYVILHYWIALFGDSEAAVRTLSLVFSVLSLPVLYKLGEKLYDRSTGLLSCFFGAISLLYISQAQEGRMYALAMLLAMASMLSFFYLFDRPGRGVLAGYVSATALLLYTHYSGFFILLAQNVYAAAILYADRRERRGVSPAAWLGLQGAVLLLFLPWAVAAAGQLVIALNSASFLTTVTSSSAGFSFLKAFIGHVQGHTGSGIFANIVFPILVALLVWRLRDRPAGKTASGGSRAFFLLLAWYAIPVLCMAALYQARFAMITVKYSCVASPAVYIMTAAAITKMRHIVLRIAAAVITLFFLIIHIPAYYASPRFEGWREASAYICANAGPRDLLLFNRGYFIANVFDYYCKRTDLRKVPFPDYTENVPLTAKEKSRKLSKEEARALTPLLAGHDRVWYMMCYSNDIDGHIKAELLKAYKEAWYKNYSGLEVILLEKK